jgi:hypothetical protein
MPEPPAEAVSPPASPPPSSPAPAVLGRVATAAGYVLALSYPILALSIGVRAIVQLCCRPELGSKTGPALSLVAALVYVVAAIGFARRDRPAWYLSVAALGFELVMVLAVGTVTWLRPAAIQHSAWRNFGQDYGYFLLIQPLLGLLWLFWPTTRAAYGVRRSIAGS